jgi:hypothetical protein
LRLPLEARDPGLRHRRHRRSITVTFGAGHFMSANRQRRPRVRCDIDVHLRPTRTSLAGRGRGRLALFPISRLRDPAELGRTVDMTMDGSPIFDKPD